MKVKNNAIYESSNFLKRLNTTRCRIKLTYKIKKFVDIIEKELRLIEKVRHEIIYNHQELDKDGNRLFADKNKRLVLLTKEGEKQLEELLNIETDIDFEQFTLDELDAANAEASATELENLRWMIKD
jgi:undecaprenyl pyrophosphate synthase